MRMRIEDVLESAYVERKCIVIKVDILDALDVASSGFECRPMHFPVIELQSDISGLVADFEQSRIHFVRDAKG